MGAAGILDYIVDVLSTTRRRKKQKKQLNTVSLKVRMDCEGCQRKVKNTLSSFKGVKKVDVDLKQQKATVSGYVDSKKVVKKLSERTGKKVEAWPYVPYTQVAHPYVNGVYDKKAPPGFVRKTDDPLVSGLNPLEEHYALMFSDENPNACSLM